MGLIMRTPPAVIVPAVEEVVGIPEFWIDGAVFRLHGGAAHALCYVERGSVDVIHYEVVRIHLPLEGLYASLLRGQMLFNGGGAH
jgi:hypothetical protein